MHERVKPFALPLQRCPCRGEERPLAGRQRERSRLGERYEADC